MFAYDAAGLAVLELAHSPERLGTYDAAAGGDRERAIELYLWNTAVSAAFYGGLQALEVGLRNAIHRELSRAYGPAWYDEPRFRKIDPQLGASIDDTRNNLRKQHRAVSTGRLVAGISFGFWTRLYSHGKLGVYENYLWRPALHRTFPGAIPPLKRGFLANELDAVRLFRNRIAHHEPIFNRNLQAELARIRDLSNAMYPGLGDWIDHHSRCSTLFADRPRPRQWM